MAALGLGSALPRTANAVITEQELPDCPILPNTIGLVFLMIFSLVKSIFHKRGSRGVEGKKYQAQPALPRTAANAVITEQELPDCPILSLSFLKIFGQSHFEDGKE